MHTHDTSNEIFHLAANFVNQTNKPIFLTGKAGTGKTTFLKYIRNHTHKNTVVVAPTGVAAINAGGVTMHSFFQLPFGPYIPVKSGSWTEGVTNEQTLIKNIRFNSDKRELIRELDLLIIDEASMVRADMLDAADTVLRHFRNRLHEPFGGVQVLYIGDLFQLPPVVKNDEWRLLSEYYESPFFFNSQVVQKDPPLYIELKKIYRQSESSFIRILNNVRNNQATADDLEILHERYLPGYMAPEHEPYITLTTHNHKADEINNTRLRNLPGHMFEFKGQIQGEFNENALPVERNLQLKIGAQVMFIKNDKGEVRRYYNGKIGTIKWMDGEKITVTFPNEPGELTIDKEEWKNIRYSFNKEKNKVDEQEIGSYTQYPIRLAWAITIHKSQGLTFEKCIVDAGEAFAPGQVYVALSRLTGLEGMILRSRILPQAISTDERVLEFSQAEINKDALQDILREEQKVYITLSLLKFFDWSKLVEVFKTHYDGYAVWVIPDKDKTVMWFNGILQKIMEQQSVAAKFKNQLEPLFNVRNIDYTFIYTRTVAASDYFINALDELKALLKIHFEELKVKKRVKKYTTDFGHLFIAIERKKQEMKNAKATTEALMKGENSSTLIELVQTPVTFEREIPAPENYSTETMPSVNSMKERIKAPKGESQRITLEFFRKGKTIAEIATLREYAVGTIESHLAGFISTGEVRIEELVSLDKLDKIMRAIDETGDQGGSGMIKQKLGEGYSYAEIKAVLSYKQWLVEERK